MSRHTRRIPNRHFATAWYWWLLSGRESLHTFAGFDRLTETHSGTGPNTETNRHLAVSHRSKIGQNLTACTNALRPILNCQVLQLLTFAFEAHSGDMQPLRRNSATKQFHETPLRNTVFWPYTGLL